ncbi:MAG: ABC transporter substrate-binding protein [Oscillospiraceae bacterium]|nr:ABC transporter substrate-binding protein [Oscillospiraceae bacterium]
MTAALTPALLAAALAGCGSGSATGTQSTAAPATEAAQTESVQTETAEAAQVYDLTAEENTIRFATQPGQIRTAINILASELGYYEEEGVNVEFVNADSTSALTAISTNKSDVDVLGTGIVPGLTFIANGADIVIFEGTAAEGGAIICQEGKKILSGPAELCGNYHSNDPGFLLLGHYTRETGGVRY